MLKAVCIDCANPAALVPFWEYALGYRLRPYDDEEVARLAARGLTPETDPEVALDPPDGAGPTLWLNKVPEGKRGKNRVHVDVYVGEEGIAGLVERGATLRREPDDQIAWWILTDPEDNEFCVFER